MISDDKFIQHTMDIQLSCKFTREMTSHLSLIHAKHGQYGHQCRLEWNDLDMATELVSNEMPHNFKYNYQSSG